MRVTALFDWPNEQGVAWYACMRHDDDDDDDNEDEHSYNDYTGVGEMCFVRVLGKSLRRLDMNRIQRW